MLLVINYQRQRQAHGWSRVRCLFVLIPTFIRDWHKCWLEASARSAKKQTRDICRISLRKNPFVDFCPFWAHFGLKNPQNTQKQIWPLSSWEDASTSHTEHLCHQHDQELLKNTIFVTHFQSLHMLWPHYPGVDPDVDFVLGGRGLLEVALRQFWVWYDIGTSTLLLVMTT